MTDTAQRMLDLFRGCELGHGTYSTEERKPGQQKTEIKSTARTLREPASVEMWEQHLRGDRPLGVIPIMKNGTCWWGVIDIDEYQLSHRDIALTLDKFKIPMYVCRSKSGGAHVFVFFSDPIAAEDLMHKLREIASILGHGNSEIFPKQASLNYDRGDLGNWLNMPYFRADKDKRYCVNREGRGLSVDRFLDMAEAGRVSSSDFIALKPAIPEVEGDDLDEGPPCLQTLAAIGVSEGGRNNALFAYGVLAKKKFPDTWEAKLEEWNHRFFSPALGSQEVRIIISSLKKKEYSYKCKDQPICNHCDAMTCKSRRFGVGEAAAPPIASITILDTEDPIFIVTLIDGLTIECTSEDLSSPRSMKVLHLRQNKKGFGSFKQDAWDARVNRLLEEAQRIEAPPEVGASGAFRDIFENWLMDRSRARDRSELRLGRPWLDEENNLFWFTFSALRRQLSQEKFTEWKDNKVMSKLKDMGAESTRIFLDQSPLRVWKIPTGSIEMTVEKIDIPRSQDAPI